MIFVKSIDDLDQNARTLLETAFGHSEYRNDAISLISKASVLYPVEFNGSIAFVPSRFIGYKNNNLEIHNEAKRLKERDGKETNPAINKILGIPKPDFDLEKQFIEFCLELDATAKGRFPKKFWRIEATKNSGRMRPTAIDDLNINFTENKDPEYRLRMTGKYVRNDKVRKDVIERASGVCEYGATLPTSSQCRSFKKSDGTTYLECHHVISLAEQGVDKLSNVIALCPNHHKEAHFGENWKPLQDRFLEILKEAQL